MKIDFKRIEKLIESMTLAYIERPGEVSRYKKMVEGELEGNEDNHVLWFLLGGICYIEGVFERAAECFENCVNLDPTNAQYHKNLAFALRQMGKYEEFDDIIFGGLPG